ncbi:hypothetical protein [Labrenzia sp. DG1229]|uniref:hypothetical protein n=1 Tax=Labrenzia sp. DG1229 TaxID=681847 RepID=UPI0012EBF1E6|nr:hypothetical protein [Labrenzia sp. DG1229]
MRTPSIKPTEAAPSAQGSEVSVNPGIEPRLPLGTGTVIGESFSILLKNMVHVIVASAMPMILFFLPIGFMIGSNQMLDLEAPQFNWPVFLVNLAISLFAMCAALSLSATAVNKLAYDAKHLRRVKASTYFKPTLSAAPIVALLTLAIGAALLLVQVSIFALSSVSPILAFFAFPVFFVVYFWTVAACSLMPAVAVIEKAGLSSLKRSIALTKGYRLPVLGTIFLAGLCSIAIQIAFSIFTVLVTVTASLASETLGAILSFVSSLVAFALMIGYLCIVTSLIYIRLREIREGAGIDQIEAVFE